MENFISRILVFPMFQAKNTTSGKNSFISLQFWPLNLQISENYQFSENISAIGQLTVRVCNKINLTGIKLKCYYMMFCCVNKRLNALQFELPTAISNYKWRNLVFALLSPTELKITYV